VEIIQRIVEFHDDLTSWRRDIHAHPELGFDEQRTSELVAQKLKEFGYEVHRGIGRTGVVGRLRAGNSPRSIGLRADMDALPIQEATNLPYRSRHEGRMHACGHDGHTTMLLGAARYLAETRYFDGTPRKRLWKMPKSCHSGARAQPASPESTNTGLRHLGNGQCSWVPGMALWAIPE
jgi:hippurate hydrolase